MHFGVKSDELYTKEPHVVLLDTQIDVGDSPRPQKIITRR